VRVAAPRGVGKLFGALVVALAVAAPASASSVAYLRRRPQRHRATVVARGKATAKGAGVVKLKLMPTKAAKRAAEEMRKVTLTIKVSQAGAAGKAKVKLK